MADDDENPDRTAGGDTDARTDEELRRTMQAQEAHGGSMAPGAVDATGHPVAEQPPSAAGR